MPTIKVTILDTASQIKSLIEKVEQLTVRVHQLEAENKVLRQENARLKRENAELKRENANLKQENKELRKEIKRLSTKKDSHNSHTPPSQDMGRRPNQKSLREKSKRKPGGQSGHKGHTLKFTECPDETKKYIPHSCEHCGRDLADVTAELKERRQVYQPIIKVRVIEHALYHKTCSCGHGNEGQFPDEVKDAPVSYDSRVEAIAGYLHTRQYMPYHRMSEFFRDVFTMPISVGTLKTMVHRLSDKSRPYYGIIKERLMAANCVGSDETSAKVNGKKHWMWTWQTARMTFIAHTNNRGFATIEEHFPEGFPNAALVHDRYAAHFKTKAKVHQICLVHLLRDLQYLDDLYEQKCDWVKQLQTLIKSALNLKKKLKPPDYYKPDASRKKLKTELTNLLGTKIDGSHKKVIALQKNLAKHSNSILTFLYHPKVPPDNNGSEQAIRNVKVKQKVSGLFRSEQGADAFAVLRSITDTVIKSKQNIFTALNLLASLAPE